MIQNVRIVSTKITNADHGCLVVWLALEWPGGGHGFGGYGNYQPNFPQNDNTGMFIWEILRVLGVSKWEQVAGQYCRFEYDSDRNIIAIGHITEDRWFVPKDAIKKRGEQI